MPSIEISITKKKDSDIHDLDAVCAEIQDLLNRIRQNESLQFVVTRQNDGKTATMQFGISDCDAKEAILRALKRKARIECKNYDLIYGEKKLT